MIYNLLKDMQSLLSSKGSLTATEQEILRRIAQTLPTMRNVDDTELLLPGEVLVRICPGTKCPVLVCHDGDGQCSCLHNDTVEEDAVDVKLWLSSFGKECNGNRNLMEAVVDLSYNAGADNLWEDTDSRPVAANIIEWAKEFETKNASNDWQEDDYLLAIDEFYKEKTSFREMNDNQENGG